VHAGRTKVDAPHAERHDEHDQQNADSEEPFEQGSSLQGIW